MDDNSTKVCANCKYFKRYYIIGYDYTFRPTDKGFCSNTEVKSKTKFPNKCLGCELWQPYELQKLGIRYGMEMHLQNISKTMEKILAVLRDAE